MKRSIRRASVNECIKRFEDYWKEALQGKAREVPQAPARPRPLTPRALEDLWAQVRIIDEGGWIKKGRV